MSNTLFNHIRAFLTRDTSTGSVQNDWVTGTDVATDKRALDTFIQGGAVGTTPAGLKVAGRFTELTLTASTWLDVPTSSLTSRNALGIQNLNPNIIKLNTTAPAGFVGWQVRTNGELFLDITDAITLKARAETLTVIGIWEFA